MGSLVVAICFSSVLSSQSLLLLVRPGELGGDLDLLLLILLDNSKLELLLVLAQEVLGLRIVAHLDKGVGCANRKEK